MLNKKGHIEPSARDGSIRFYVRTKDQKLITIVQLPISESIEVAYEILRYARGFGGKDDLTGRDDEEPSLTLQKVVKLLEKLEVVKDIKEEMDTYDNMSRSDGCAYGYGK
jgi:hypothetical protein